MRGGATGLRLMAGVVATPCSCDLQPRILVCDWRWRACHAF